MTEPCQYGRQIVETNVKVTEIYEHLVGTLDKPGLVGRIVALERWKRGLMRILGWSAGTVITATIGAVTLKLLRIY